LSFFDFDNPSKSPFRFVIPLDFPEEDKRQYPWLNSGGDRFYLAETALDRGGYSIPYVGYPCDQSGNRLSGADRIVIKLPNLSENRESNQIEDRLRYIGKQSIAEWALVRKKLIGCKNANPIFDFGTVWTQNLRELFVTVQPYISDALPLKKWLVNERKRQEIVLDSDGNEIDNWFGLSTLSDWLRISTFIGKGLVEIHRRRVIHGDVWPPNIYVRDGSPEEAVFIDFGESFVATPTGETHNQPDHPYRAPERSKPEYVPSEQVDVYSFGKLMLYLAIGKDFKIPRGDAAAPLSGHRRRHFVRDLLFSRNKNLIADNPGILDIIAKCTTLEPVDRTTMLDVVDQLERLSKTKTNIDFIARLERVASDSKSHVGDYRHVFTRLIDRRVEEAERLIECCRTDMVELRGTRDELISDLAVLFSELQQGDSWTTLTTPSMWQHSALGLDGRYATATFEAVCRGAAVHRTYVLTVEELGVNWSCKFAAKLESTAIPDLLVLAKGFRTAIAEFNLAATREDFRQRSPEFERDHRYRFICVLESLQSMIDLWNLRGMRKVFSGGFSGIRKVPGLFLGLIPVSTATEVRKIRTENPVSLLYVSKEKNDDDKWLLVMTDIRGRTESEAGIVSLPQLLSVKVFKSKQGYPRNRVLRLEETMRQKSTNIGEVIETVYCCAVSTEREIGEAPPS